MLTDRQYDIGQEHYYDSADDMAVKVKAKQQESDVGHNGLDHQYYKKSDSGDQDDKSKLNAEDGDLRFDSNKIGVFWRHEESKINKTVL